MKALCKFIIATVVCLLASPICFIVLFAYGNLGRPRTFGWDWLLTVASAVSAWIALPIFALMLLAWMLEVPLPKYVLTTGLVFGLPNTLVALAITALTGAGLIMTLPCALLALYVSVWHMEANRMAEIQDGNKSTQAVDDMPETATVPTTADTVANNVDTITATAIPKPNASPSAYRSKREDVYYLNAQGQKESV